VVRLQNFQAIPLATFPDTHAMSVLTTMVLGPVEIVVCHTVNGQFIQTNGKCCKRDRSRSDQRRDCTALGGSVDGVVTQGPATPQAPDDTCQNWPATRDNSPTTSRHIS